MNFCNREILGLGRCQSGDSGLVKTARIIGFRIPGLQSLVVTFQVDGNLFCDFHDANFLGDLGEFCAFSAHYYCSCFILLNYCLSRLRYNKNLNDSV